MDLRDAQPQVLFLESGPDCNLVCLIPSTHIAALQSLPSGCCLAESFGCVAHLPKTLKLIRASLPPNQLCYRQTGPRSPRDLNGALVAVLIDSGGETRGGSPEGLEFELS